MSTAIHPQNVIALVWDFDKTLIPGYMQDPIFAEYGVDPVGFWREVNALPGFLARAGVHVHPDTAYLNHLLTYVQHNVMPGLTNHKLRELGAKILFHQGLPEAFDLLRRQLQEEPFAAFDLRVEHYIVSTGLRAMIEGSAIAPFVDGIWASEFIEVPALPGFDPKGTPEAAGPAAHGALFPPHAISQIAVAYDNTSKTRALFEINKGSNKDRAIDVNAMMKPEDRRVPFQHMIYVADGPSDVPAFSVIKHNHGAALAVYDEANDKSFEQAERLHRDDRIDYYGPADFRPGTPTMRWLTHRVRTIAAQILEAKKAALKERVGVAPRHLSE